jgi:hypothetical protein
MFTLNGVVPWGRSFDEYCRMFALTEADLRGRILGCADGPASFNAEATRRGSHVVSCDPLYTFDESEIRERITATSQEVLEQTRQKQHEFVWTTIKSIEDLSRLRAKAMEEFLADYEAGKREGSVCQGGVAGASLPEPVAFTPSALRYQSSVFRMNSSGAATR